jgi:hypothetical protein
MKDRASYGIWQATDRQVRPSSTFPRVAHLNDLEPEATKPTHLASAVPSPLHTSSCTNTCQNPRARTSQSRAEPCSCHRQSWVHGTDFNFIKGANSCPRPSPHSLPRPAHPREIRSTSYRGRRHWSGEAKQAVLAWARITEYSQGPTPSHPAKARQALSHRWRKNPRTGLEFRKARDRAEATRVQEPR